jgi:hypothetical protein
LVKQLAPDRACLAVLEHVDAGKRVARLLTCIFPTGEISSYYLPSSVIDEPRLAVRLRNRLRNWLPSRPGDPFDLVEWKEFEEWLQASLKTHLPEDSHIVSIEHENSFGIPWHVAVGRSWTSSYAPDWNSVLTFGEESANEDATPNNVGIVMVPRFRERQEVLAGLRRSARHAQEFAEALGIRCFAALESECDAAALITVLGQAEILKLLCHGFVETSGEVALMLAYNGNLPLADSVAAGTLQGKRHRLSWRDLQQLAKAPRVVFSAACSSGASRLAGLREQLGLFNVFRQAGTRSMIAPRWDIVAEEVLPLLDEIFERNLQSPLALARTLRSVSLSAETKMPHWLAWSLALEGAWK